MSWYAFTLQSHNFFFSPTETHVFPVRALLILYNFNSAQCGCLYMRITNTLLSRFRADATCPAVLCNDDGHTQHSNTIRGMHVPADEAVSEIQSNSEAYAAIKASDNTLLAWGDDAFGGSNPPSGSFKVRIHVPIRKRGSSCVQARLSREGDGRRETGGFAQTDTRNVLSLNTRQGNLLQPASLCCVEIRRQRGHLGSHPLRRQRSRRRTDGCWLRDNPRHWQLVHCNESRRHR